MRIHESRPHLHAVYHDNRETFQHCFSFLFHRYFTTIVARTVCEFSFVALIRTRCPSRSTSRGYAFCSYPSCPCDVAAFRIVYPLTKNLYNLYLGSRSAMPDFSFHRDERRTIFPPFSRCTNLSRARDMKLYDRLHDKREDRKGKKERVIKRESRRNAARRNMDNDVGRASRWAKELRRRPASARGCLKSRRNSNSRPIERSKARQYCKKERKREKD